MWHLFSVTKLTFNSCYLLIYSYYVCISCIYCRHFNLDVVENMFDAIVTDPPYGIRAGAKKSGNTNVTVHVPLSYTNFMSRQFLYRA